MGGTIEPKGCIPPADIDRNPWMEPEKYPLPRSKDDEALLEKLRKFTERPQEIRTTDPTTGAQKGMKIVRFSLIPFRMLWELAEHYGGNTPDFGGKYPENNWRKGYDWKLSEDALWRHWGAWKMGQRKDPETGRHHLICAIWHLTTLFIYDTEGLGTDTIRTKELAEG